MFIFNSVLYNILFYDIVERFSLIHKGKMVDLTMLKLCESLC